VPWSAAAQGTTTCDGAYETVGPFFAGGAASAAGLEHENKISLLAGGAAGLKQNKSAKKYDVGWGSKCE